MPKSERDARMKTQGGRAGSIDEVFGPMASYQQQLGQAETWISFTGDGAETKPIKDMAPAYAINALHKLERWHEKLFAGSTAAKAKEERAKLVASPLVGALIEQALGDFYIESFITEAAHYAEATRLDDAPHVDEVVALAEQAQRSMRMAAVTTAEDSLLEASIDGVVALQGLSTESTTGQQVRVLYGVLVASLLTIPETP